MKKFSKVKFLLMILKPKRFLSLFLNSLRELRRNGPSGVLRRAKFLVTRSRHRILIFTVEEWKRTKKEKEKNKNYKISNFFCFKEKDQSVVVIIRDKNKKENKLIFEKLFELARKIRKNGLKRKELVLVFSGVGQDCLIKFKKKFGIETKIFCYNKILDKNFLINKGIKESEGREVILLKEKKDLDFFLNNYPKIKKENIITNNQESRSNLSVKIGYIVPSLGISGGIAVVLNHVNRLLQRGYDVSLISFNKSDCQDWFNNEVPVIFAESEEEYLFKNFDIVICTHWSTAFYADLFPAKRKIYFVQSDERRFNPENKEEIRTIEETYKINFEYMTEAIWIQRWLKDEFGHNAYYVPNGIDLNVFHKAKPIEEKTKKTRVLLEGGIDIWFKGMDDAYNAVKGIDCDLWIVSCQGKPKKDWNYNKFFENVSFSEMKYIYSSCDIFLKMSKVEGFFGPPLEAMACGCAVVVSEVTGYDEYIKDGYNALVVKQGDTKGARMAVERLIKDKGLREKLIQNGFRTAKEWSWDRSIDFLEKVINKEPIKKFYTDNFPKRYFFKKNI